MGEVWPLRHDLSVALRPLLMMSRALGLAPFSLRTPATPGPGAEEEAIRDDVYGRSRAALCWSALVLCGLAAWAVDTARLYAVHVYPRLPLAVAIPHGLELLCLLATCLTSLVLACTVNTGLLAKVFRKLHHVDAVLHAAVDRPAFVSRARRLAGVQVAAVLASSAAFYAADATLWTGPPVVATAFLMGNAMSACDLLMQAHFLDLVLLLRHRFRAFNRQLKTVLGEGGGGPSSWPWRVKTPAYPRRPRGRRPALSWEALLSGWHSPVHGSDDDDDDEDAVVRAAVATPNDMARVLGLLWDMARVVNLAYGLQVLLLMASVLVGLLWCSYLLLAGTLGVPQRTLYLCRCTQHLLVLLSVTTSCQTAGDEAARTGPLVAGLGDTRTTRVLSLQALHQRVQFTACGLFPLNHTLLYLVLAAVATYLVLLVQVQQR